MKKYSVLAVALMLAACAEGQSFSSTSASSSGTTAKMKACLMSEANSRYQAGTLFTNTVKATASDMVKTCAKNLALQATGISAETQSTAESIISNLKTLANAQ